jgi:hypothetical protein
MFPSGLDTEHGLMTALWMQANGAMEHQNRDVLKRLCIAQANGQKWRVFFFTYLLVYSFTLHPVTVDPPGKLMLSRPVCLQV